MEQENQRLKMANLKQTEQMMLLQDKLQGGGSPPELLSWSLRPYFGIRVGFFWSAERSPFIPLISLVFLL